MRASKIRHKDEDRIMVEFPYSSEISLIIRGIPDAKWSKTLKAWHIPYTKAAFTQLKNLFPEIEYPQKPSSETAIPKNKIEELVSESDSQVLNIRKEISIMLVGRKILIKLPKNEIDTRFIVGIRFSRWDGKNFCWIVPNYPGNLDLIKDYFNERISDILLHEEIDVKTSTGINRKIGKTDLLIIKTKPIISFFMIKIKKNYLNQLMKLWVFLFHKIICGNGHGLFQI